MTNTGKRPHPRSVDTLGRQGLGLSAIERVAWPGCGNGGVTHAAAPGIEWAPAALRDRDTWGEEGTGVAPACTILRWTPSWCSFVFAGSTSTPRSSITGEAQMRRRRGEDASRRTQGFHAAQQAVTRVGGATISLRQQLPVARRCGCPRRFHFAERAPGDGATRRGEDTRWRVPVAAASACGDATAALGARASGPPRPVPSSGYHAGGDRAERGRARCSGGRPRAPDRSAGTHTPHYELPTNGVARANPEAGEEEHRSGRSWGRTRA